MSEHLVIVESPAKAKTISGYLGKNYKILASYGHIRDLPSKKGSVLPDEDFAMHWELSEQAAPRLHEIQTALKSAKTLLLATDPDREGEAIAWHLHHVLSQKNGLADKKIQRVMFHEITQNAILKAIENARNINQDLVDAYLARRALDYLVGFSISPLLWRKVSSAARSAGRVQSVALRLICQREKEIELFKAQEFWTIAGKFSTADTQKSFWARLTHFDGKKLDKFAIANQTQAEEITAQCRLASYVITNVQKKIVERAPPPPFITSTLQQDAANKLGFRAAQTMIIAQKLYEGIHVKGKTTGLISYMRTDSVNLSKEAIQDATALVNEKFGAQYSLPKPRHYKSKVKNAQEAHEAIRPTNFHLTPDHLRSFLTPEQFKLYELIWKRSLVTQMANSKFEKVAVDLQDQSGKITLRTNGSILIFDGYQKLYLQSENETKDHGDDSSHEENDENRLLPPLTQGENPTLMQAKNNQHFTLAPPRYSDASLIKRMEELGIGRPSTYAPTLQVLISRKYVHLEKKRFIPDDIGRIICSFLELYFPEQIEYNFTAQLEDKLDEISHGKLQWKQVLANFWQDFHGLLDKVEAVGPAEISHQLDQQLAFHYFPSKQGEDEDKQRLCSGCQKGRLELKTGKFGVFIACNNYPECRYTSPVSTITDDESASDIIFPKSLGVDPNTGLEVSLRKGPYGLYLQLGDTPISTEISEPTAPDAAKKKPKKSAKKDLPKPKRTPLPKLHAANMVTLDIALDLLKLPREVGVDTETGEMITAAIGRFGPFLKYGTQYVSLKEDDVLEIGINRAIELISENRIKREGIVLGVHPETQTKILLRHGRYGKFIQHGEVNVALGRKAEYADISLGQALNFLANAPIIVAKKKTPAKPSIKTKTTAKVAKKTKITAKATKPSVPK